ncbi:MAG TPA: PP2C family serine/threonine-protein phosphatase [Pyrinomonadaceae bacterium]|nr:PP2C family serine/threonine-protein phosphatase [Pyrinomonadaceae bacterium]
MENNFKITSASVSDRGLSEKRPENEDSFLVLEERGVYAVADGVGGAQAGDVASQMAVEILGEAFINQSADLDAEDVMRAAIERANGAIYQMASELPQLDSMATTIVALHVYGNIATIGHVGDSRAYRLDHNGNLLRETNDHSVVEEEVRAGRMTPEQAAHHPSKNIISRALGAEADVEIDLKTIMVEPGTTFLLCSDGITRHVDDAEIGGLLSNGNPSSICDRLKEICYARGAEDNLTAVVVRVAGEPAKELSAAAGAGEIEEPTVATARSPFDSTVDAEDQGFSTSETISLDDVDDDPYLMDEEDQRDDEKWRPEQDYSSSSVIVPAQLPAEKSPPPAPASVTPYRESVPQPAGAKSPGILSTVLSSLLFLVIGGLLGVGGYYYWLKSQPEPVVEPPPVITEMKSNNTTLTAFEDGRRLVDKDPAGYINANAASLQTPEDYFLMGRAFMLTGKYWEAKRSFNDSRNRLASADPLNAKTLASEISMALAIIESPQATESFTRDITTANAAASANSNTGASANSNVGLPSNTNSGVAVPIQPLR